MSGRDDLTLEYVGSDMVKAFQELAKGETTASALESRLTDIESRIDQLLASVEEKDKIKHDSPVAKPETKDVVIPSRR